MVGGLVCHFVSLALRSWQLKVSGLYALSLERLTLLGILPNFLNRVGYFTQLPNLCWVVYPTCAICNELQTRKYIGAFLTLPIYKQAI